MASNAEILAQFYVAHTGQSDYGVYDRHGGSSPVATGMSEEMAKRVADLLSRDAEIVALKEPQ